MAIQWTPGRPLAVSFAVVDDSGSPVEGIEAEIEVHFLLSTDAGVEVLEMASVIGAVPAMPGNYYVLWTPTRLGRHEVVIQHAPTRTNLGELVQVFEKTVEALTAAQVTVVPA